MHDIFIVHSLFVLYSCLNFSVRVPIMELMIYEIDGRTGQDTGTYIYGHKGQDEMTPGRKYGPECTMYRTGKHDIGVTSCCRYVLSGMRCRRAGQ